MQLSPMYGSFGPPVGLLIQELSELRLPEQFFLCTKNAVLDMWPATSFTLNQPCSFRCGFSAFLTDIDDLALFESPHFANIQIFDYKGACFDFDAMLLVPPRVRRNLDLRDGDFATIFDYQMIKETPRRIFAPWGIEACIAKNFSPDKQSSALDLFWGVEDGKSLDGPASASLCSSANALLSGNRTTYCQVFCGNFEFEHCYGSPFGHL